MPRQPTENKRKIPKQDRAKDTIEVILKATTQLFNELGYEHTSTNHIAKRAGISIGTLYHYFPNKDSIVSELINKIYQTDTALLRSAAQKSPNNLKDAVSEMLYAIYDAFQVDKTLRKTLYHEVPRFGPRHEANRFKLEVADFATTLFQQHGYKRSELTIAITLLVEGIEAILYGNLIHRPSVPKEELVPMLIDMVFASLKRYAH